MDDTRVDIKRRTESQKNLTDFSTLISTKNLFFLKLYARDRGIPLRDERICLSFTTNLHRMFVENLQEWRPE